MEAEQKLEGDTLMESGGENSLSDEADSASSEESPFQEDGETPAEFQVMGTGVHRPIQKPVFSSLPPWLAHPVTVEYDLQRHQVSLDAVDISPKMRRTLKKNNIGSLFPG